MPKRSEFILQLSRKNCQPICFLLSGLEKQMRIPPHHRPTCWRTRTTRSPLPRRSQQQRRAPRRRPLPQRSQQQRRPPPRSQQQRSQSPRRSQQQRRAPPRRPLPSRSQQQPPVPSRASLSSTEANVGTRAMSYGQCALSEHAELVSLFAKSKKRRWTHVGASTQPDGAGKTALKNVMDGKAK